MEEFPITPQEIELNVTNLGNSNEENVHGNVH